MPKIQIEIKDCQGCPFLKKERLYTADSWEEAYDWFCKKELNTKNAGPRKIAGYVEWRDTVEIPKWCPIKVKG